MRIIKIGKDKSNDIHKALIDDPGVSRIHCEIFLDDEGNVFLTDKDSTNGTFVNGNKIYEPQMLDELDVVRVGNSVVDWKGFIMNETKEVILEKEKPPIIEKQHEIKHQKTKSYDVYLYPILLLISFVIIYQVYYNSDSSDDTNQILTEPKKRSTKPKVNKPITKKNTTSDNKQPITKTYYRPKNGFSPYDKYFGKGIYDSSSSSYFLIKNSNATDAVVLLVDAYSRNKIRNEYIRKGTNFKMTSVPRGTYYLQWVSGNNWSPDLVKGDLVGCFQNDMSFTKTRDRDDWMKVTDLGGWTVTLYTVAGGDVESEKISANDFLN
jgi:hypothetical protein